MFIFGLRCFYSKREIIRNCFVSTANYLALLVSAFRGHNIFPEYLMRLVAFFQTSFGGFNICRKIHMCIRFNDPVINLLIIFLKFISEFLLKVQIWFHGNWMSFSMLTRIFRLDVVIYHSNSLWAN